MLSLPSYRVQQFWIFNQLINRKTPTKILAKRNYEKELKQLSGGCLDKSYIFQTTRFNHTVIFSKLID